MAAAVMEGADHGLMLALCNTKYAAFGTSVRTDCSQFHQHAVTMHGVADLRWRNKDVTLQLALCTYRQRIRIRGNEPIAIAVHVQPSGGQVLAGGGSRQRPALLADGNQLAAPRHGLQKLV